MGVGIVYDDEPKGVFLPFNENFDVSGYLLVAFPLMNCFVRIGRIMRC